ncbi:MAG TPA: TonB-dependent receptor plug domain-containing protein, partial [Chitinophagaceae bacterium]|nr:TonB-dependent receptor plug domain-containing protein [Chitinophagaceae bacterium]
MKLTTVFIIAACLQVTAKGHSQKVTLKANNIPLVKVFEEIRKQTGYQFFYADEMLVSAKKVSVNIKNGSIEEVLDFCFKNQQLSYTISENTIIIKKKIIVPEIKMPALPAKASIEIRGKVTDEKGQPLEGATILVKGTSNGTRSDATGNFSINAESASILIISYVGFESVEIKADNHSTVSVQLKPLATIGEQIVVIGYGTQKKSVITGAISSVKASDIDNQPIGRIEQFLQGRASGLTIAASSGQPGASSTLRIRGTTSINNSDPLYVVDGIPVDINGIDYLNPNDIESIEVLKDAASAAIYGARAASGVILVTTKKGKAGPLLFAYNGYYGTQAPAKKRDMLNATQYATLQNEASLNSGGGIVYANPQSLGKGTDWQSLIFNNNAKIQDH